METPRYELKINAFAPGELAALVNGLAEQLSGKVKAHIEETKGVAGLEHPIATKIKEELATKEEKQGNAPRGRKAKTQSADAVETTTVETAPADTATSPTTEQEQSKSTTEEITKEQIAQALQGVSEKVNFQKAKEILTSFKNAEGNPCKKVSDVQAADYGSFMAACKAAI